MITIGSTLWNGLLVALSLAVGAVFAVRAASAGTQDRAACLAHALMGVAMAGMFWPPGDPMPTAAGTLAFAVLGAWFAASWLHGGGRRVDGPAHVAIGSAAMALMYLTHSGGPHLGHSEHALHGGGATTAGGPGALLAAAGLLLTGYFLWHALESLPHDATPAAAEPEPAVRTARKGGRHRRGAGPWSVEAPARPRLVARVEPAARVAMSLLMAVMFLGTI